MTEIDTGIRCDRHIGEVYPVRCFDCDAARATTADELIVPRVGYIPGSECPLHPYYPLPCSKCERGDA